MILFFIVTAVFAALIWLDYYRQIDVYHPEKLVFLVLIFLLGGASTLLVLAFDFGFPLGFGFKLDGFSLNTFLYFFLNVALVEELCKLLPLLVMVFFFKKELNEPIDYLAYIGVSALGFACVENVLYFNNYGPSLIDARAILSTIGHVFDSSLVAYGFILVRFYYRKNTLWVIPAFFGLGALSHTLFNFILEALPLLINYILVVIYFFFTISIFSTILNNALNNSPHFSYAKTVNSHNVTNRLISGYIFLFSLQFCANLYELNDFKLALGLSAASILSSGFVVVVSSVRLSRFTLIEKRWFKIKLELPFTVNAENFLSDLTGAGRRSSITIKGDAYNDAALTALYKQSIVLAPGNKSKSKLKGPVEGFLEEKLFLHNNESAYLIKLFLNASKADFDWFLLKAKTQNQSFTSTGTPIVALLTVPEKKLANPAEIKASDCRFVEWCLVKPLN